jgi:hypothetical protein
MSNQNVWDNVDIFGVRIFEPDPCLVVKKNIGTGYFGSFGTFLTAISFLVMFFGIVIIAIMPESYFKVPKPDEFADQEDGTFRIIYLIGYLFIYGYTCGKMSFTGETEQFWHYSRTYCFTNFVFALGLIFFYKSGWWPWLSLIFFGFGIFCFLIAASFWSAHKKLVYQFAWENLGDGQKFLIIQKGHDVMLYELKDKINEVEYEKIVQQKQKALQSYLDERKEAVR